jgi:hypothetical protein
MQYYKAKVIITETTTKRFVANELMTVFSYEIGRASCRERV